MVVNQAFVHQLGLEDRVVGRKVFDWRGEKQYTIVGVVADERLSGPSAQPQPFAYFPVDHWTPGFATFVARVRGQAEPYLAICRDALRQLDPSVPVYDVKTLDQRLTDNLRRPRFYTIAILFFGGFALLLALIGIYGLAAYGIAQRTHEIGVRIAVGARLEQVRLMLLRQSMAPLMPKRFTNLVPKLKASDYDYIIFDMPAVSQISVTPRLARFMDMMLIVVESEKTDREVVQRAAEMLTEARGHVGIVLNKWKNYVPRRIQQEL